MLLEHGPSFGYNLNKCHLIVKPEFKDSAIETLRDMEMEVEIVEESRVLGSVIGSDQACRTYLERVAHDHTTLLRKLADQMSTNV